MAQEWFKLYWRDRCFDRLLLIVERPQKDHTSDKLFVQVKIYREGEYEGVFNLIFSFKKIMDNYTDIDDFSDYIERNAIINNILYEYLMNFVLSNRDNTNQYKSVEIPEKFYLNPDEYKYLKPVIRAKINRFTRELLIRELYFNERPLRVNSAEWGEFQQKLGFPIKFVVKASNTLQSSEKIIIFPEIASYGLSLETQIEFEQKLVSQFNNRVFLIAKCCDEIDKLIELVYKPVAEEHFGFKLVFQEESEPKDKIHDDIWENIKRCKLILCDLTGNRPNCYIEYGYALGINKEKIILMVEDSEGKDIEGKLKMPFDTLTQKFSFWKKEWLDDPEGKYKPEIDKFKQELTDRIRQKLEIIDSKADI